MPSKDSSTKPDVDLLMGLVSSMTDGVIGTNQDGKVEFYNGAALNLLDLNQNLRGKDLSEVGNFVDKNNQPLNIKELLKDTKNQFVGTDFKILFNDKSSANLYLSIARIRSGYGKKSSGGYVLIMRDITHEKSLEQERDEFISVVSHELRTPITVAEGNISNALYIFNKTGGDKSIEKALKTSHEQILFLGGMINDLSTLSRAERGKLNLEVEPINVHELVQNLNSEYAEQAKKKGLIFHTSVDMNLELVYSSKLYVQEILQNFITNAIKYTENGSVTVCATKNRTGVLFEVIDTGIGISKSDQEKVFDKFFRSEDYRTRASSGTGLGLYVTMKLARLINAEISLNSKLNEGTTFSISVPNLKAS